MYIQVAPRLLLAQAPLPPNTVSHMKRSYCWVMQLQAPLIQTFETRFQQVVIVLQPLQTLCIVLCYPQTPPKPEASQNPASRFCCGVGKGIRDWKLEAWLRSGSLGVEGFSLGFTGLGCVGLRVMFSSGFMVCIVC